MKALVYYSFSEIENFTQLQYIDLDTQDILDSIPKSAFYGNVDIWDYLTDIAKARIESIKLIPFNGSTLSYVSAPEGVNVYYKVIFTPYYIENDNSGTISDLINKTENLISSIYRAYNIDEKEIKEKLENVRNGVIEDIKNNKKAVENALPVLKYYMQDQTTKLKNKIYNTFKK